MDKLREAAVSIMALIEELAFEEDGRYYIADDSEAEVTEIVLQIRNLLATPVQQAEQEPVAIDWEPLQNFWRNNSGVDWEELESAVKCAIAALGKPIAEQEPVMITPGGGAFPFAVVGEMKQAQQSSYAATPTTLAEPVATVVQSRPDTAVIDVHAGNAPLQLGTKLYAAPVRTKDLTDDEIWEIVGSFNNLRIGYPEFARAVITADRKLNGVEK